MTWRGLIVVLVGLSSTNVASFAQRPPDGESPSITSLSPLADRYFSPAGIVRFQMIGGRISLDPPCHRKGSKRRETDEEYESVRVTAERGIPSLHYVCHTPEQQLTVSVGDATELRIESRLPPSGHRSVLEQPEIGAIRWTLSGAGTDESYTGETLLHIREQSPEQFDRHHDAILTCLLRGRSLRVISEETRAALMERLETAEMPDRSAVLDAVDALKAPHRGQRVAAERRLLGWGTPILPIVAAIDPDRLGPEQSARLTQIRQRLRRSHEDTPASLAMRLINDREHWERIAPRMSQAEIERANSHLSACGLADIDGERRSSSRVASAP